MSIGVMAQYRATISMNLLHVIPAIRAESTLRMICSRFWRDSERHGSLLAPFPTLSIDASGSHLSIQKLFNRRVEIVPELVGIEVAAVAQDDGRAVSRAVLVV